MKINEFTDPLKTYLVTVRVVLKNVTSTVRTSIRAESSNQAFLMLSRMYGVGNVQSISELVRESARTSQIQREAAIRPLVVHRRAQPRKIAQNQPSQVHQQQKCPPRRQVSARPIADPIKHDLVQDKLTTQFMRQSNIVKPTSDDIRIAKNRAETALKRTDLELKNKLKNL